MDLPRAEDGAGCWAWQLCPVHCLGWECWPCRRPRAGLPSTAMPRLPGRCSRAFAEHRMFRPNSRRFRVRFPRAEERGHFSDLLATSVRPALIVGMGLAIFQQITGINTVIYYAPSIIQSAGISSAAGAILATSGIGLVNVLMTIVAMWLIDRAGRRPLLLTGISGMVVCVGVLGYVLRTQLPRERRG